MNWAFYYVRFGNTYSQIEIIIHILLMVLPFLVLTTSLYFASFKNSKALKILLLLFVFIYSLFTSYELIYSLNVHAPSFFENLYFTHFPFGFVRDSSVLAFDWIFIIYFISEILIAVAFAYAILFSRKKFHLIITILILIYLVLLNPHNYSNVIFALDFSLESIAVLYYLYYPILMGIVLWIMTYVRFDLIKLRLTSFKKHLIPKNSAKEIDDEQYQLKQESKALKHEEKELKKALKIKQKQDSIEEKKLRQKKALEERKLRLEKLRHGEVVDVKHKVSLAEKIPFFNKGLEKKHVEKKNDSFEVVSQNLDNKIEVKEEVEKVSTKRKRPILSYFDFGLDRIIQVIVLFYILLAIDSNVIALSISVADGFSFAIGLRLSMIPVYGPIIVFILRFIYFVLIVFVVLRIPFSRLVFLGGVILTMILALIVFITPMFILDEINVLMELLESPTLSRIGLMVALLIFSDLFPKLLFASIIGLLVFFKKPRWLWRNHIQPKTFLKTKNVYRAQPEKTTNQPSNNKQETDDILSRKLDRLKSLYNRNLIENDEYKLLKQKLLEELI